MLGIVGWFAFLQPYHECGWRHARRIRGALEGWRLRIGRLLFSYGVARRAGGLGIFETCLRIANLSHWHVSDVLSLGKRRNPEHNP
jgi:hypothetical protein